MHNKCYYHFQILDLREDESILELLRIPTEFVSATGRIITSNGSKSIRKKSFIALRKAALSGVNTLELKVDTHGGIGSNEFKSARTNVVLTVSPMNTLWTQVDLYSLKSAHNRDIVLSLNSMQRFVMERNLSCYPSLHECILEIEHDGQITDQLMESISSELLKNMPDSCLVEEVTGYGYVSMECAPFNLLDLSSAVVDRIPLLRTGFMGLFPFICGPRERIENILQHVNGRVIRSPNKEYCGLIVCEEVEENVNNMWALRQLMVLREETPKLYMKRNESLFRRRVK